MIGIEIQWYPGHMAKAKGLIQQHLKVVDMVFELVDARIPLSSRNPDIDGILGKKPRIVVLNKADLADDSQTAGWLSYFKKQGHGAVTINSVTGQGISQLIKLGEQMMEEKKARWAARGMAPRALRAMVVGIPNVGKSSLINRLARRTSAKTGDKPGVTRGKQWIRVSQGLELLDTPGLLWPKFQDREVGLKLAFTGAVSDLVVDTTEVASALVAWLKEHAPTSLVERYKIDDSSLLPEEILLQIGRRRGCLLPGGKVDKLKAGGIILQEFRAGKVGRFTLDTIPVEGESPSAST